MSPIDTSEKGLESLIVATMTGRHCAALHLWAAPERGPAEVV
jgi:hypothetical protein